MKRQRIFSYILTFLIIGMCARNLSYVYALEENGGSASVFSEDAGQGETEEPMAEEKEEDPVPEEEMDAPQEEPPQEEPSGDEPPQEETPQEEPSGGEPGEPEAAGTGTEGSGDPARPGGTEGAGGPSDSGTQGGQTPEDSGDEDGSGNPDTPEKPAGSGEESGKGPEDEEIKEEPEEELEEEQDEVSEILTAADLFQLSGSSETAKVGEEFTLQAEVDLPEDEIASLQWQISWNGTDWEDIEEADGTEYSFLPEEKSFAAFYRLTAAAGDGRRFASGAFTPERAVCYTVARTRAGGITTFNDLEDAINDSGEIYVTQDIKITDTIAKTTGSDVTVQSDMSQPGAPFTLTRNTKDTMIRLGNQGGVGTRNINFKNIIINGAKMAATEAMIYVTDRCTLTLGSGAILKNAISDGEGGAVYVDGPVASVVPSGKLIIEADAEIYDNQAKSGGGIYVGKATGGGGVLEINGGTISGNTATGDGGGIYAAPGTQVTVSNCTFENNTASLSGGAVFMTGEGKDDAAASFTECEFIDNTTTNDGGSSGNGSKGGGAVALVDSRNAIFTKCSFQENNTAASGGAVLIRGDGDEREKSPYQIQMVSCTISGNQAYEGGGLAVYNFGTAELTETNILENTVESIGGGIFSWSEESFGLVKFNSGTIAGNTSGNSNPAYGAGIVTGMNNNVVTDRITLILGPGRISIQDEICLWQTTSSMIAVEGTKALDIPRGEQIPIRFAGLISDPRSDYYKSGVLTIQYPDYNDASSGDIARREPLKYRYVADGYGFMRGTDAYKLAINPEKEWWQNAVHLVWKGHFEEEEPLAPVTDLYVHSQYGVDPTDAEFQRTTPNRSVPAVEYGTEAHPLQTLYMAYKIAASYYSDDTVRIHLMDTQKLGENVTPEIMILSSTSYTDGTNTVVLPDAEEGQSVQIVRHNATPEVITFTGSDGNSHSNANNTDALFSLDNNDSLTLSNITIDGQNIEGLTDDSDALVYLNSASASLEVSGGAILKDNTYRAIYTAAGSVTLNGATIRDNTISGTTEGAGSGIWQGSSAALALRGTNTIPSDQEIWLNADNSAMSGGAKISLSDRLTLNGVATLSVDFPNYVDGRVIAEYTGVFAPDEAEAEKYVVDEIELQNSGLNKTHEDSQVLLKAPKSWNVSFLKLDKDTNKRLVGVKFKLYQCNNEDPGHAHADSVDGGGAEDCWQPVQEDGGDKIYASQTDDRGWENEGRVEFGWLTPGDYLIEEVSPLPGYQLPEYKWLLQVEEKYYTYSIIGTHDDTAFNIVETDESDITGGGDGISEYILRNKKELQVVLPDTGGVGAAVGVLAGASVLTGTGASLLLRHSRGKRRKKR